MIRSRRLKTGWHHYVRIYHDKRQTETLLGITKHKKPDAQVYIKLGEVLQAWESGLHPNAARMAIGAIKIPEINKRYKEALTVNVIPFFAGYKVAEISEDLIAEYIESRWGKNKDGKLLAVKSTWDKERRAFNYLVRSVVKGWTCPQVKTVETLKAKKHPLNPAQIQMVGKLVAERYQPVYWIMAYTGMDIGDAVTLAPEHVDWKRKWISKQRGKTSQHIDLPIIGPLGLVLKRLPVPLDASTPFLKDINASQVKVEVKRGFARAGLPEYSSKDLRRFIASKMGDLGYSETWIKKALGHSPNSKVTQRYIGVYDETLRDAFKQIERKVNE